MGWGGEEGEPVQFMDDRHGVEKCLGMDTHLLAVVDRSTAAAAAGAVDAAVVAAGPTRTVAERGDSACPSGRHGSPK